MAGAPGKHGAVVGVTPESGFSTAGSDFGQAMDQESHFTAALSQLDALHRRQVASLLQEVALLREQNQRLRLESTASTAEPTYPSDRQAKPGDETGPVVAVAVGTTASESDRMSPKSLGSEPGKSPSFMKALASSGASHKEDQEEENDEDEDEEKEQPKSTVQWITGYPLDIAATFFIIANTIVMLAYLQWQGYENRVVLGLEPPGGWSNAESVFKAFEYMFTSVFITELIIRLSVIGWVFLKDPLNCLDAVVVLTTTVDAFILSQFDLKLGVGAIRLIRMVKLAKTFRMARALKLVEPLRILIRTIHASVLSLVWSMVILFLFMLVSAILLSQTLQNYVVDETAPLEYRLWVDTHYGDAAKALWTMFEITLSGGWPNWVSPLVQNVSAWYALFFGMYVSLVAFAVIRVITALFLKTTLAEAAKDKESLVQERIKGRKHDIQKLEEIFKFADSNSDGAISAQEFHRALRDDRICALFSSLDVDPDTLGGVFHLLDNGDGLVSLDEFLEGIMRLKGSSRTTDLLNLLHDNRKVMRTLNEMEEHFATLAAQVTRSTSSRASEEQFVTLIAQVAQANSSRASADCLCKIRL